jgi:thiamine-phosphate pyrophosphorylase
MTRQIRHLSAIAERLNRDAGSPPIPALMFLTDPIRTPDPVAVAHRLPPGTALIYRHFGAPDRAVTARRLAAIARVRQLTLLISADPDIALAVGAAGVHWPEARLPDRRDPRFALESASAHGASGVQAAARFGTSLCLLGPVFPTRSAAGNPPIGLFRASQFAWGSGVPVLALGGVNAENVHRLINRGFAGLAAIEALL